MRFPRMQYAHPTKLRIPAVAREPQPLIVTDRLGNPKVIPLRKHGGERSKYQPHQGKQEMERRCGH